MERAVACNVISGGIRIQGPDITGLEGMSSITSISGHVYIDGTALTDLAGLENLASVDGQIYILNNALLASSELPALKRARAC